jgi:hypothetical protein
VASEGKAVVDILQGICWTLAFGASTTLRACHKALLWKVGNIYSQNGKDQAYFSVSVGHLNPVISSIY